MTVTGIGAALALARSSHTERIEVGDLAAAANYSPFHFTRLFTSQFGLPPGQYLTALRIDTAKRLLLGGDDAIIDIATAVGFDSLSSFTRRFSATVGVAPGQLRRLADRVVDTPPQPFARLTADTPPVLVEPSLPAGTSPDTMLWLGWYPQPAPIGLPATGTFVEWGSTVRIALEPSAPWLLGFAVEPSDDPLHQLIPRNPLVAVNPVAVTAPQRITLHFTPQDHLPLLSALPSLCARR